MSNIFQKSSPPNEDLFFHKNDASDVRLGEIVSSEVKDYKRADIVILGCPQDEGVARNKGRLGARLAPDAIRRQFYKLTNFRINAKIFDIGNTIIQATLEETHDVQTNIVKQILIDGKTLIVLGGGNDISYADGKAMAEVFGYENWAAINIDAHFDIRADEIRNSGTPYRGLLEEKLLNPKQFYEIAWQPQANSLIYFEYLQNLGVITISLDELRKNGLFENILSTLDSRLSTFLGFDVDSVRASDAPGVSAPSPIGLSAEEFVSLAEFAGRNEQTKIIEFTEVNPNFDIDNRTTKLAAIAMHKFCGAYK